MEFHCEMLRICNHISSLGNALETIASSYLVKKTFVADMLEQGPGTTNFREGVRESVRTRVQKIVSLNVYKRRDKHCTK